MPVTNIVFYSQPAANADILITKDVSTDNGTDFVINDLVFEIQYDFTPTSGNLRELTVRVGGDLAPVIALSPADINGRTDGVGDFSRIYPSFQPVTLQAPAAYGDYLFDRWLLNNQLLCTYPITAVVMSGNMQVEARYRLSAGAPMLKIARPTAGQISFSFQSDPGVTYTLEQSPRVKNPVWSQLDTRTGDGTTIQMIVPTGSGPINFYRVRMDR